MGKMSGVMTVAAGYPQPIGSIEPGCAVLIKALYSNAGLVFVGNDGSNSVNSSTGFPLKVGDIALLQYVNNLADIFVASFLDGDGVAWIILHE